MGATVHFESFLPGHYSMRDLSEDSNSCSWSVHCGDKNFTYGQHQNGSSVRPVADSHSGYERDFVKRTMLEHEAVFKNQVSELHRLYRIQRTLMDDIRQKNLNENMNQSEATPETGNKRQVPGFLSGNLVCGRSSISGSSSPVCNVPMQNGDNSKDGEVLEVRPVKVRRKMIDLQLPAEEYMDTDEIGDTHDNMKCPPYEQSKLGKEVDKMQFLERGNVSHQEVSSGSGLRLQNLNGFADLNEPVHCQESELVASSKDIYSLYGRNNTHAQGQCLEKDISQNVWKVLEAGRDQNSQRDKLRLPYHSVPVLSDDAFQPPSHRLSDHNIVKFPGERTFCELEARSRHPEVSYDSFVESSVASSAPSSHGRRPEFVRPWTHWLSSWDNPSSSAGQKSLSVQPNPFLNCNTQAIANSSFEIRCRDLNGFYQGSSSEPKEAGFSFPPVSFNHLNDGSRGAISNGSFGAAVKHHGLETVQRQKKHDECSVGLSWLKPKPPYKSEITNGCLDLNASINQFTDETDMGDGLTNVSPHKSLRSVSCSNNADMGRVGMTDFQSSRRILGFPIFEKHSIVKEEHSSLASPSMCITGRPKEEDKFVLRDLDINLPCDGAVSSIDQHGDVVDFVDKEESKCAASFRHHIDLNICASEDEDSGMPSSLRVKTKTTAWIDLEAPAAPDSEEEADKSPEKTKEETWGLQKGEDGNLMNELIKAAAETIVVISFSDHRWHPDEAASSSTDGLMKDPLSWFADTIASCGDDLENQIDVFSKGRHCEGCREESSSGGFDYFEAMTLNLAETKEEDYMPKPLVPENLKFDETGSTAAIPNRPRRGQARRGRPKRDFQRDILPGLTSLSRHEVTEDLQMFGGLMKATGCSWNSGVARRNTSRGGSNRGRRRLVTNINRAPACPPPLRQPMNDDVQVAGLEDRSLTGWGRATRRPRRQRCPAGNPPTVILT